MVMRHITGENVLPSELNDRVLADELVWMKSVLEHQPPDDNEAVRIRTLADDALHFGRNGTERLPYWQSVHAFTERYGKDMQKLLHLPTSRVLVADFQRRFHEVLLATQRLKTTEPIEQFDVEFRQYLADIADMMHEFKHLASEKGGTEVTLDEARLAANSAVIARAWDQDHNLTLVKHGTTLPVVLDDGSLEGRSTPVILELGTYQKHGGGTVMQSTLRPTRRAG